MVSNARPEVVIIQGTATIDNSPFNYLAQEELESILRFITSKDHMKKNITNVEFNYLWSRDSEGGKFRHSVGLKLHVRTSNLWETPRSYVFRHVGQDSWEKRNGSAISITRIHQK